MSVDIACPQCKGILKAPPGMAGKKARCKRCQHAFRIPGGDPGAEDSVSDSQDLSVVSGTPFAFNAPAAPPPAVKKPVATSPAAAADNPFAIPTAPPAEVDEPTPEPKSKSRYKTKPESSAKSSSYRGKSAAPPVRGNSIKFLLAGLLCAVGGAGGFYAYSEYQKSQTQPAPVAKATPSEPPPAADAAKANDDTAKKFTTDAQPAPSAGATSADRRTNAKPTRGGPKVSGGLKLPPFAEKPKLLEKAVATIALEHDVASVKQVMLGGAEGPVVLVTRRTFDGLGGKGMKDTIDRYALNTLRRIDQTEVSADAVTAYPRIADVGPGGDRFAFEHPAGKLTVVQLGTKTVLVDGLDLAVATDDKDKAVHPGIAAIYFLTDDKLLIVTKAGVVESWELAGKKKVGASEAIPGAANLVDRRSLAFYRDRDPAKSRVFAYAGGTIHSISPAANRGRR